jgi:hypothetical protein
LALVAGHQGNNGPAKFIAPSANAGQQMWLAASISLLGTNLTWSPHPGTQIVGRILVTAGGLMIIWIEIEEEKQEDSE